MKRRVTLSVVFGLFLTALLACTAIVCLPLHEQAGYADYHKLLFYEKTGYYSSEDLVTYTVFVHKTLYDETFDLSVQYQKVKVNPSDKGNVTVSKGKVTGTYEVLEEKIVTKEEIKRTEGFDSDEKYYSFDVKTNVNCVWIFTVMYKTSKDDDEWSYEYPGSSDLLYCTQVDTFAPRLSVSAYVLVTGGYRFTLRGTDLDDKSAISGIRSVRIYQKKSNETEKTIFYEKNVKSSTWSDNVLLPSGKVIYTYEIVDAVGNKSEDVLATFNDEMYNEDAETYAEEAIAEMEQKTYATSIRTKLTDAYTEYMFTTRREDATEEEKQNALRKLNEAETLFTQAKQARETGTADFKVVILGEKEGVSVSGEQQSLAFLPIGESAVVSITVDKITGEKKINKEEEAEKAGIKDPNELYAFTMQTTSRDSGVDFMVARTFEKPLKIKIALDEYEEIAAVQKVYSQEGNATYYECLVVAYADGTVCVETPYTGGIVHLFVKKKENKLYWLFALTAVPVVAGGILILWANRKLKKVKEEALKKQAESSAEPPEKEKPKPANRKNKKKK